MAKKPDLERKTRARDAGRLSPMEDASGRMKETIAVICDKAREDLEAALGDLLVGIFDKANHRRDRHDTLPQRMAFLGPSLAALGDQVPVTAKDRRAYNKRILAAVRGAQEKFKGEAVDQFIAREDLTAGQKLKLLENVHSRYGSLEGIVFILKRVREKKGFLQSYVDEFGYAESERGSGENAHLYERIIYASREVADEFISLCMKDPVLAPFVVEAHVQAELHGRVHDGIDHQGTLTGLRGLSEKSGFHRKLYKQVEPLVDQRWTEMEQTGAHRSRRK